MTLYTQQGKNIRKTWYLMIAFLIFVIAAGYAAAFYMGNPFILYGAVLFAIVMNVGSYWYSDTLVIKMTGAKPVSRESHPQL